MIRNIYEQFMKKNIYGKTNAIAFGFLCLFVFGCSVTGGGHYLMLGGVSLRILLGILCIMFSIPSFLKNIRNHIKEPINVLFLAFIVWFIISAIRGALVDNNKMVFASDIKGFMYLFLVPIAINCITNKKRIHAVINVVLTGAFVQACIVFLLHVICVSDIANYLSLHDYVIDIQLGFVTQVSGSIFRIFLRSSPYLIIACALIIYRQVRIKKRTVFHAVLTAIYLNALLFSYTRSLYLSAGIVAMIMLIAIMVLHPKCIKNILKYIIVTVISLFLFITCEEIVFEASYFNFAVARTFNTDVHSSYASQLLGKLKQESNGMREQEIQKNEEMQKHYLQYSADSDSIRSITKKELLELIKTHPFVGNGLGACSATRNAPDEYFYLDILARMGIVGLLLYLLPYIYMLFLARKNKWSMFLVLSMLTFWVVTAFNPWMNAAIGISWYAITASFVAVLSSCEERTEKWEKGYC